MVPGVKGTVQKILTFFAMIAGTVTGENSKASEEDWIVYLREAEPSGFIISVNLAISSGRVVPASAECWLVQFQFTSPQLAEQGMPNAEGQAAYRSAEDLLTKAVEPTGGEIVAARTGQGSRSVWFCGSRTMMPALQKAIGAVQNVSATFRPASLSDIEALHPTTLESQLADNHRILEYITQKGDDLITPRKTRHFIYGVAPEDRRKIETRLKTLGFQLEPPSLDISRDPILFSRLAPLEISTLDNDVRTLAGLCAEFNCEYDGWETEVIAPPGNR
ncbi:ribonuclease E inhibitor RraB [Taklimakanibacter lacteus]|uniref:ribonuclease E inhibitor RraB n=1 Tax=Taklimakanibacter lacteus TaxID=2268456 RepID=UPI000E660C79